MLVVVVGACLALAVAARMALVEGGWWSRVAISAPALLLVAQSWAKFTRPEPVDTGWYGHISFSVLGMILLVAGPALVVASGSWPDRLVAASRDFRRWEEARAAPPPPRPRRTDPHWG